MKTKLLISSLLALLAIAVACSAFRVSPVSFAYPGTNVYIDPPIILKYNNVTNVGDTFTIQLWYGNMTDLGGFQYTVYWNSTLLNCTSVHDSMPWSGSPFIATNTTDNAFNATHGQMNFVVVSLAGSVGGNYNFRNATFTIISAPVEAGSSLQTAISFGPYGGETIFGDSSANLIPADVYNSLFVYTEVVIPEYPSFLGVLFFAVVTLLTVMVYKRKSVR